MTVSISEQHYAGVRTFKQLLSSFQRNRDLVRSRVCQRQRSDARQSHRPVAAAGGDLQQGIFERADWGSVFQGWSVFSRQCHNPRDNGRWQNMAR
ncbi:hypothetical protein ACLK1T_24580 [Escherichia coli]